MLKVVNDPSEADLETKENIITEERGLFASIRNAFTKSMFGESIVEKDQAKNTLNSSFQSFKDSVVVEK